MLKNTNLFLNVYNNSWQYFVADRLGSVRQIVDPTGQLLLAQSFEPFGNVLEQSGMGQSVFGYTGEQTDPTGLVFLRARHYSPAVGRFLTADSIIPDPLRSGGWNRYIYVGNNPIRYTDPSGHCFWDLCLTEGAIILEVGILIAGGYHIYADQQVAHMMNATTATDDPFKLPGFNSPAPGTYSQPTEGFSLDETLNQCSLPGTDLSIPGSNPPETFPLTPPYSGSTTPGFYNNPVPLPNISLSSGKLVDGAQMSTNEALDTAIDFLGPGYKDMGNGRLVSADGRRQVRIGDSDILGHHGGGRHMNFEELAPNPFKFGKMQVVRNIHIYLTD